MILACFALAVSIFALGVAIKAAFDWPARGRKWMVAANPKSRLYTGHIAEQLKQLQDRES